MMKELLCDPTYKMGGKMSVPSSSSVLNKSSGIQKGFGSYDANPSTGYSR